MKKSIFLSVFFLAMVFNAFSQDYYYIPDSKKSKSTPTNKAKRNSSFIASVYFINGKGYKSSDAYISGGGGKGFDISLGYNFSKYFGFTTDIGKQQTFGEKPSVKANLDFSRWQLLLTPKLLLPIKDKHQFNLGCGAGWYFGITYIYVSGTDNLLIFTYRPSLGFHALCEYKYHLNRWLSVGVGAKYYVVTYKKDWAGGFYNENTYIISEFKDLKGDGLDYYSGITIRF